MWFVRREISSSRSVWVDSWTLRLNFCREAVWERERDTVNTRLLKEFPVMSLLILLSSMSEATYTLHFPSHLASDSRVKEAPQLLDIGVRRVLHLEPFLCHQTQHPNIIWWHCEDMTDKMTWHLRRAAGSSVFHTCCVLMQWAVNNQTSLCFSLPVWWKKWQETFVCLLHSLYLHCKENVQHRRVLRNMHVDARAAFR